MVYQYEQDNISEYSPCPIDRSATDVCGEIASLTLEARTRLGQADRLTTEDLVNGKVRVVLLF